MSMRYGIGISEETLMHLKGNADIEKKLETAFYEISFFESDDVNPYHLKQRDDLFEEYLKTGTYSVSKEGILDNKKEQLIFLELELLNLCIEIIKYNSAHLEAQ